MSHDIEGPSDARAGDLAEAKAWLCARWHQDHPNEQHIKQLADYAAHLRATPPASTSTAIAAGADTLAKHVAEVMAEDGGCWTPCSGCQESDEGYVSEELYPYSSIFKCQPGGGCSECGGIGVVWNDGEYLASWGDDLSAAPKAASVAEQLRADLHNVQRNTAIYRQEAKDRADAADRRAADANARADAAVEANRRLVAMMETPKAASEDGATRVRDAAQSLSDRLDELEWIEDDMAATCRDFFGHVDPAHARLRDALVEHSAAAAEGGAA